MKPAMTLMTLAAQNTGSSGAARMCKRVRVCVGCCRDAVEAFFASGASATDEDGVEDAFDLQAEISERVRTCVWVGDCFVYNNAGWRLNYCVGGEVTTVVHLDRPMYLLGYLASHNRVFLIDK